MVRASGIHEKEKTDKMSIVEMTNAVIYPWTMVVCNDSQNVEKAMPRNAYPFAARNYRAVSTAV
jgi:hypothetical protein